MQTYTPQWALAPTAGCDDRAVANAIRAVDRRWAEAPRDLQPGPVCDAVLSPLVACTRRVAEPGAPSHMLRVGRIAEQIARVAGWADAAALELRVHGALHDIGKLGVSAAILNKPGPLSEAETEEVQRHAEAGFALLSCAETPLLQASARVAHEHHERWDGGGYPRALRGTSIDLRARVVAIADVYDALTSRRPYRSAMRPTEALSLMVPLQGTHFDPSLFDAFVDAWKHCAHCQPA